MPPFFNQIPQGAPPQMPPGMPGMPPQLPPGMMPPGGLPPGMSPPGMPPAGAPGMPPQMPPGMPPPGMTPQGLPPGLVPGAAQGGAQGTPGLEILKLLMMMKGGGTGPMSGGVGSTPPSSLGMPYSLSKGGSGSGGIYDLIAKIIGATGGTGSS